MEIYDPSSIKEVVFQKVSEFEIFSYALDIDIDELINIINCNYRIFNPFQTTEHPSMSFSLRTRTNGTTYIYCKDFANDLFSGDCIALLGRRLNLNCNINTNFIKILKYIIANESKITKQFELPNDLYDNIEKSYIIEYRDFQYQDVNYLNSFDLTINDLSSDDYKPIRSIYDNILRKYIYSFRSNNLAYSYITNKEFNIISRKLYLPYNKIGKFKIINGSSVFEDPNLFHNTNRGKRLIIAKSRKDKLVLTKHLKLIGVTDIYVTNVSSETAIFDSYIEDLFKFYTEVYTFYDLDKTGVRMSIRYRNMGIPSLLPNHGKIILSNIIITTPMLHIKDYAEMVNLDKNKALLILTNIVNQI